MQDLLVTHAVERVWCNPEQDTQYIVGPYRITPPRGGLNQCQFLMRQLALPTQGVHYHLFQIGQLPPAFLRLIKTSVVGQPETWVRMDQCCEAEAILVDVYTDKGISIPRHQTYFLFSNERNLVIAIEENPKLPIHYRTEQPYLRFYSNAYFETPAAKTIRPPS